MDRGYQRGAETEGTIRRNCDVRRRQMVGGEVGWLILAINNGFEVGENLGGEVDFVDFGADLGHGFVD